MSFQACLCVCAWVCVCVCVGVCVRVCVCVCGSRPSYSPRSWREKIGQASFLKTGQWFFKEFRFCPTTLCSKKVNFLFHSLQSSNIFTPFKTFEIRFMGKSWLNGIFSNKLYNFKNWKHFTYSIWSLSKFFLINDFLNYSGNCKMVLFPKWTTEKKTVEHFFAISYQKFCLSNNWF